MDIRICPECRIKLKSNYIYLDRKRITVGQLCPLCCKQFSFTNNFRDYQTQLSRENQTRAKRKPKFSRQRKTCPYCRQKGIENRLKWKIRKMQVNPGETPHWKCTCQKCGRVWTQNTSEEYFFIDRNLPKPEELMGAPL